MIVGTYLDTVPMHAFSGEMADGLELVGGGLSVLAFDGDKKTNSASWWE